MHERRLIKRILLSTMPRSGTVFFFNLIASLFEFKKIEPRFTSGMRPDPPEWDPYKFDRSYQYLSEGEVLCAHYHLNEEIMGQLEDDRLLVIYLYRDPRDVGVSAALYIKYVLTHSPLHGLFSQMTEEEAIALTISGMTIPVCDESGKLNGKKQYIRHEGMKYFCNVAYQWLAHPRVAKIRFEDLVLNPSRTVMQSLLSVGVEVSGQHIQEIFEKMSFTSLSSGRVRGQEDKHSHFRKGVIGDFKNYYTEFHRSLCKHYLGEDLIRLGYERDLDW